METTKIIEVNGVKMELDARTAKVQEVQTFHVGDTVLLLVPGEMYEGKKTKALPGLIVDFANFKEKPTIVVAYLTDDYRPAIKTAYINKDSSGFALVHTNNMAFDAQYAMIKLSRKVEECEAELLKAKNDLDLFKRFLSQPFAEVK